MKNNNIQIRKYEEQYMEALKNIYFNGFSDGKNERTGLETKRLPGVVIQVDVEKEFPVLKSKFVATKTALREILWIWQQHSNNINDLKSKIWNEWADKNGSIGEAYGNQAKHPVSIYADSVNHKDFRSYESQTHYVLEYLREFPHGRWAVSTLWNPAELSLMHLVPCCHTSTWNLDGGRLNCVLDQRSGDFPYGVPFNTTQYAELMILYARDLGVKPGILTHVIADAHIYSNQMEGVEIQINNYEILCTAKKLLNENKLTIENLIHETKDFHPTSVDIEKDFEKIKECITSTPHFECYTKSKSFWDVKPEECKVEGYANLGKISFGDIAV